MRFAGYGNLQTRFPARAKKKKKPVRHRASGCRRRSPTTRARFSGHPRAIRRRTKNYPIQPRHEPRAKNPIVNGSCGAPVDNSSRKHCSGAGDEGGRGRGESRKTALPGREKNDGPPWRTAILATNIFFRKSGVAKTRQHHAKGQTFGEGAAGNLPISRRVPRDISTGGAYKGPCRYLAKAPRSHRLPQGGSAGAGFSGLLLDFYLICAGSAFAGFACTAPIAAGTLSRKTGAPPNFGCLPLWARNGFRNSEKGLASNGPSASTLGPFARAPVSSTFDQRVGVSRRATCLLRRFSPAAGLKTHRAHSPGPYGFLQVQR